MAVMCAEYRCGGPPYMLSVSSVLVQNNFTYISIPCYHCHPQCPVVMNSRFCAWKDIGIRVSEKLYLWPTISERWATELMWPEIWFHRRGLQATVIVLLYQNNPPSIGTCSKGACRCQLLLFWNKIPLGYHSGGLLLFQRSSDIYAILPECSLGKCLHVHYVSPC